VLVAAGAVFALSRRHIFPVLGILSCLYLIYYLPPSSWLRFAAWLNLGFVIYVAYGAVHSRLTGRHTTLEQEHDRHTARVGAALAVVGVALLLTTRVLDVWLAAAKKVPDAGALATLPAAFQPGPWLEVSWFLIVPLAVNAFLLCPVVIRRALRSRGTPSAPPARASAGVAMVVMAATAAYLWMLADSDRRTPRILSRCRASGLSRYSRPSLCARSRSLSSLPRRQASAPASMARTRASSARVPAASSCA
jgi:hypothetical protein